MSIFLFSVCAAAYGGYWVAEGGGCTACPPGTIKLTAGNAACTGCLAGQTTNAAGTGCQDCPPNTYSANVGDPCTPCDATTETTDGLTGKTACGKKQTHLSKNC